MLNSISPYLKGDNLIFQPLSRENIELYARWVNLPENRQFIPYQFPVTKEHRKRWYDSFVNDPVPQKIVFEIVHIKDQTPIGYAQLDQISWIHRSTELGFIIGDVNYQGEGYGKEIIEMLEQYAFAQLNLRKIKALVVDGNNRSMKVFEGLNYSLEATLKAEMFYQNQFRDAFIFTKFKS